LPSPRVFIVFLRQDHHERQDRLPGLLAAEGEDEDGRPAPSLRRRPVGQNEVGLPCDSLVFLGVNLNKEVSGDVCQFI
jgi:hypothetical protein